MKMAKKKRMSVREAERRRHRSTSDKIKDLLNELQGVGTTVSDLDLELQKLADRREEEENELEEMKEEIYTLKEDNLRMQDQIDDLEDNVEGLESERDELKETVNAKETQVEELESQVDELDTKLGTLSAEHDELQHKFDLMDVEYRNALQQIEKLKEEADRKPTTGEPPTTVRLTLTALRQLVMVHEAETLKLYRKGGTITGEELLLIHSFPNGAVSFSLRGDLSTAIFSNLGEMIEELLK